jgi:hypothetical protein
VLRRWQERRTRNQLLMRELLLRLEAERVGAPGKSGTPTHYFREQSRRLLLRHPRLAARYRREARRARRESLARRQGRAADASLSKSA